MTQAVMWERFQLAVGIMATSQYDAVHRLSHVHAVLVDTRRGMNIEIGSLPLSVRGRYQLWLANFEAIRESGLLTPELASNFCHELWTIYQMCRLEAER